MVASTPLIVGGRQPWVSPKPWRRPRLHAVIVMGMAALAMLFAVALVSVDREPVEKLQFLARSQTPNPIEYVGEIPVGYVFDSGLMERPAVDVSHALCNKVTDPDCENSISPFVDKQAGRGQMLLQQESQAGNRRQQQQQLPAIALKARKQSLVMPWYEVASTGDGMGPETVTYWKLPPKAVFTKAQKMDAAAAAKAVTTGLDAAPPNTYQEQTTWKGDHVLNGGNKEWAEEDAALHAYNMQRWRNQIIREQINRQRSQYDLMNSGCN